jgi:hypothetical protein
LGKKDDNIGSKNATFFALSSNHYICLLQLDKVHTEDTGSVSEDSGHCSPEPESEFLKVTIL